MADNQASTSVVITCHNYGRFLKECIDSVIAQTVPPKEIIVINDASDDDTEKIAKEYGNRIAYFAVDFHNGQKTRNFGLKRATGEYIFFLDADDYLKDRFVEEMQTVLKNDDTVHLIYSDYYKFTDANKMQGCHSIEYDYRLLENFNYIPLPSLVRREEFEGFDINVKRFQDWDAWLTYLSDGKKAKRVAEPLYCVRMHGSNLTVRSSLLHQLFIFFAKRHSVYKVPFLIIKSKLLYDKHMKQSAHR